MLPAVMNLGASFGRAGLAPDTGLLCDRFLFLRCRPALHFAGGVQDSCGSELCAAGNGRATRGARRRVLPTGLHEDRRAMRRLREEELWCVSPSLEL